MLENEAGNSATDARPPPGASREELQSLNEELSALNLQLEETLARRKKFANPQ